METRGSGRQSGKSRTRSSGHCSCMAKESDPIRFLPLVLLERIIVSFFISGGGAGLAESFLFLCKGPAKGKIKDGKEKKKKSPTKCQLLEGKNRRLRWFFFAFLFIYLFFCCLTNQKSVYSSCFGLFSKCRRSSGKIEQNNPKLFLFFPKYM